MRLKDAGSLDDRTRMALAQRRNFTTETIRLLFHMREKMLLGIGLALARLRESGDPSRWRSRRSWSSSS